jgi:hypothetical protein
MTTLAHIQPVEFEAGRFWVASQHDPSVTHLVDMDDGGKPGCSCHDFMCRERECKHIRAVRDFIEQKRQITP